MKLIATGDLTQHGATRMLTQHMADCGFHRLISWLTRFCLRMQIFQLREHMSSSCWKGTFVFAELASTAPKGRRRKPASPGSPGNQSEAQVTLLLTRWQNAADARKLQRQVVIFRGLFRCLPTALPVPVQ